MIMDKNIDGDKDRQYVPDNPIRTYIHRFYPPMKQGEDEKWTTFYTTMLSVGGFDRNELEKKVVEVSKMILDGTTTLDYEVDKYPDEIKDGIRKLFKIGSRTGWTFRTINEMVLARKEGRDPNLTEFPTFGEDNG